MPPFCIPTSMATARQALSSSRNRRAPQYPRPYPARCAGSRPGSAAGPTDRSWSRDWAVITAMMRQMAAMETTGRTLSIQRSGPGSLTVMISLARIVSPSSMKPRARAALQSDQRTPEPRRHGQHRRGQGQAQDRGHRPLRLPLRPFLRRPYRSDGPASPATIGMMIMLKMDSIMAGDIDRDEPSGQDLHPERRHERREQRRARRDRHRQGHVAAGEIGHDVGGHPARNRADQNNAGGHLGREAEGHGDRRSRPGA